MINKTPQRFSFLLLISIKNCETEKPLTDFFLISWYFVKTTLKSRAHGKIGLKILFFYLSYQKIRAFNSSGFAPPCTIYSWILHELNPTDFLLDAGMTEVHLKAPGYLVFSRNAVN